MKKKTDDMLADAKKVLDDQSSTPSAIKEAKQKLEKGFEELAKQAAQAGGGAIRSSLHAAQRSCQSRQVATTNLKKMTLSMLILKSLTMKRRKEKS